MADITIVNGVYKPTNITGGHRPVPPWKLFAVTATLPQQRKVHSMGLEPLVSKFPSKWGAPPPPRLLGLPRLVLLLEHSRTPIPFTTEAANPSTHSYNSNNNSSSQNKNQKEKNRTKNKYNTKKQEKKLIIWVGIESRGIHKKVIKEFQCSFHPSATEKLRFPLSFPRRCRACINVPNLWRCESKPVAVGAAQCDGWRHWKHAAFCCFHWQHLATWSFYIILRYFKPINLGMTGNLIILPINLGTGDEFVMISWQRFNCVCVV